MRLLRKFFIWLFVTFKCISSGMSDTWNGDLKSHLVIILSCPRSKPWPGVWFRGRTGYEIRTWEVWGSSRWLDWGFLRSEELPRSLSCLSCCRAGEPAVVVQYSSRNLVAGRLDFGKTLLLGKAAFGSLISWHMKGSWWYITNSKRDFTSWEFESSGWNKVCDYGIICCETSWVS